MVGLIRIWILSGLDSIWSEQAGATIKTIVLLKTLSSQPIRRVSVYMYCIICELHCTDWIRRYCHVYIINTVNRFLDLDVIG